MLSRIKLQYSVTTLRSARSLLHKPRARRVQLLDANCEEGEDEDEQSCARQEVLVCLHQTCVFAAMRASAAATTVVHTARGGDCCTIIKVVVAVEDAGAEAALAGLGLGSGVRDCRSLISTFVLAVAGASKEVFCVCFSINLPVRLPHAYSKSLCCI